MLRLFNSFSNELEDFISFSSGEVKIFICGPTVYDRTHLGHARIFLVYDLLCRILKHKGSTVHVLVNITDINKNVFDRAIEENTSYKDVAKKYAESFINDLKFLNISTVTRIAFVSDYISEIKSCIIKLLQEKTAYLAHGNVYLDTFKIRNYGALSHQSRHELDLHRLDIGSGKKQSTDLMLWNCTESFGFSWSSQFGSGIPWWHIQDTVVSIENFGTCYDIHGGATELIYPHHEAHLAQFQALTGVENPVKIWMHVGLVLVNGVKMSKSAGNVLWVSDVVYKHDHNLVRLYLFSYHYRNDLEFSESELLLKKSLLGKLIMTKLMTSQNTADEIKILILDFFNALYDDLNSPLALEILELICDKTLQGKSISKTDLSQLYEIIGLSI